MRCASDEPPDRELLGRVPARPPAAPVLQCATPHRGPCCADLCRPHAALSCPQALRARQILLHGMGADLRPDASQLNASHIIHTFRWDGGWSSACIGWAWLACA